MQSFQNLQVVKRQQVEEFARRLIFPTSQAAVAVSENSSSNTNYSLEIVYMLGRLFTYSHCSLTNWEKKSPGKFFNMLPFNHL